MKLAHLIAVLTAFVIPSTWALWDRSMDHGERIAQAETRDGYYERQLQELKEIQRQQVEIFRQLGNQQQPTPQPTPR